MKKIHQTFPAILAVLLLAAPCTWGANVPKLDPAGGRVEDRQQLRALLDKIEKGISDLDVEVVLKLMTPEPLVTWQNGEVSRGADQVRAYHARMVKGTARIVTKFATKATLGGPAIFYGDTAVAYGTTVDTYELADGQNFVLNANWSTTVVKQDGQWKSAAIHFSTNIFDNPFAKKAQQLAWIVGVGGLLIGLIVAFVISRLVRKK